MISLTKARVVFAVSWLAYATSYFLRKPVGVLKPSMEKELGFTSSMLGCLDVALLLPYALVQVGRVGCRSRFHPQSTVHSEFYKMVGGG